MTSGPESLPMRCGRYLLLERLGGGGMAEVYKARLAQSDGPDRALVIKLLPPDADPAAAARFIDEAKIALPLTHGNITATFEFARADERPFLVMEYVRGRSLRQILNALTLLGETASVPVGLFLGREVARALRYAHKFADNQGQAKPIVHRDVSPENVLLSFGGQAKLTDFGIARSAEALDMAGAWGKPPYVAPEILAGDPGTPASDVYSLGCVIYEVLSGWPPLIGKSDAETLAMVQDRVPAPLEQLRDDLPDGLSDLLATVLQKAPEDRDLDAAKLEVSLSQMLGAAAPHFTEADMAAVVGRLFDTQQDVEASGDDGLLASRLRDQLDEAGIETTGRESAAEMLAMGTVALSPEPPSPNGMAADADVTQPTAVQSRRGVTGWLVAIVLLGVVIFGGGAAALGWWAGANGGPDASLPAINTVADAGATATADTGPAEPDARPAASTDAAPRTDGAGGKRPVRRRPATVTFNSHPWSFVYVGGRKLPGHTPVRNITLPSGRHRVRFVNPELGLSKTTTIRLAPGESRFVKVRLQSTGGGTKQ